MTNTTPRRDAIGRFAPTSTGETTIEDFGGTTVPMMSDDELADMHASDDPDREVGSWDDGNTTEAPF